MSSQEHLRGLRVSVLLGQCGEMWGKLGLSHESRDAG